MMSSPKERRGRKDNLYETPEMVTTKKSLVYDFKAA